MRDAFCCSRVLVGPRSVLQTSRADQYFADTKQFGDRRAEYKQAAALVASSACNSVGIDNRHFQIEYPFQRPLLDARLRLRFTHTGVTNASARYAADRAITPCAVMCLGCAGKQESVR
ncbi:MAG TPA: hypothetical protein VFL57_04475 [Bryobacteraceae bacterium]|nr:hypothetical protein [Bryobacteraceae bacterium]